ncbi:hypothetical protein PZN02_001957 [Sinorhizobium garamanticum]|uniref:LysR substrate binding domain-containing protein n=1 Tax=Sinorhizobium garamanticum TaxID=680247 RepID=A0ABY8D4D9_9HYPH|nr:hypothetical protein [Sinorhizobium garamanticum]WEX85730.1 hypothetical protein PZN02_001957 [Sinorhizobium garamanticum]
MMRHVWMQERRRLLGAFEEARQIGLPGFELGAAFLHHVDRHRVLEIEIHDLLKLTLDTRHLSLGSINRCSAFHAEAVHFAGELITEFLKERRLHQVLA